MTTKIATSFGLALMLAMGIFATMLALGVFTPAKVSATDEIPAQLVTPAEAGGVLAEYRFTFTVTGSMSPGVGEIRITFDKDTIIPATLSRSSVLISASRLSKNSPNSNIGETGSGQFVILDIDPVIESDIGDPRKKVVKIKVPDMNPQNAVDPGVGSQGIGTGYGAIGGTGTEIAGSNIFHETFSDVTVIFTTGAGIKTPNVGEVSGARIVAQDTVLWPLSTNLVTGTGATLLAGTTALARGDVQAQLKRTLRASGIDGERDAKLTLTGKGFQGGQTITLWRDKNTDGIIDATEVELGKVTSASDGSFTTVITIGVPPFSTTAADNRINAIDGRGNTLCPSDTIAAGVGCRVSLTAENEVGNVQADLPKFTLRGKVTVTPTTAAVGDTIQVKMEDWAGNLAPIEGDLALINLGGVKLFTVLADAVAAVKLADGTVTFEVKVPNGVPTGVQDLSMNCCSSAATKSTRRATMTITGAVITVTPATVVPNQTVTLIGRGYSSSKTINATNDASSITIGGNPADLKSAGAAKTKKFNENALITTDNGGTWSAALVIPINSTTTTAGTHEFKVVDDGGRDGTVNLVIPKRTLVLTPDSSRLGTTISFTGAGYPADNTKSGADSTPAVSILYSVAGTTRTVTTVTPDASGNISGTFTVPLDAGIPSTNTVRAEYKFGATTVTTTGTHDVPKAELTISPTSGPAGTTVTVAGVGFKGFSTVTELKLGDIDVRPAPVPATSDKGAFSTSVLVPQLNLGVATVTAKVGDTVASAAYTVTVAPVAPPAPPVVASVAPAAALAPVGANLVRVWGYDAPTQKFQLYDPAAALLSDLTVLKRGGGYWINVKSAQKVTLGTFEYDLSAGWNNVGWQG